MVEGAAPRGTSRYRIGPLERRGVLAGWRGGQLAVVAIGLVVAVALLHVLPTGPSLFAAVGVVGVSVATVTWPIGGRTGDEWLPDVARHTRRVVFGRTWRAAVQQRGPSSTPDAGPGPPPDMPTGSSSASRASRASASRASASRASAWRSPSAQRIARPPRGGPFSSVSILQVDPSVTGAGHPAAVVFDAAERTYTAVMPASGAGFVLLASSERDRRVVGWASALGALARQGTPVHRVQWVARTLPALRSPASSESVPTYEVSSEPRSDANSDVSLDVSSASRSYTDLVDSLRPGLPRFQVLLAISVRGARQGMSLRPLGAQDHSDACTLLLRELSSFRRRLADADVSTAPALAPRALASVLRAGFSSSQWVWPSECGTTWPWPVASEVLWDALRMDGTWHATYWVAEWPRADVSADFLAPLLLARDVRQSVSVTMEPLSPLHAMRRTQQARTADVADAELRRRGGFLHTARRRSEEETLADRERDLADGHAPFQFSAYVTVTTDSRDDLDASCGRVEQTAGQCGIDLRRCYGDQQAAFGFTLPLCRGVE